ncbi:nuclear factor NF-kappa-B p105 subunit-like [Tribolium madens]|uniref:nuclear factor NF-kappa-B p105 subunit-like n=1 Tax=Tribolium madens TaxID=41895 RepID=UPI001CF73A2F|nr:nuclear factor NF-kappa-B p105 subunit-like [Tribolium madens]XP_044260716.1 nuclear factor NF-kappa-B p105 subunit-like [Tribolium madens]
MELHEVSATAVSPYRCYVRGKNHQTEGPNVQTIGFKDGLAVVQVIDKDKTPDKSIDLTKLTKIVLKVDPQTGKKYIHKDGKRIEIVPHTLVKNDKKTVNGGPPLPKLIPAPRRVFPKVLVPVKFQPVTLVQSMGPFKVSVATMTDFEIVEKSAQTEAKNRSVLTQTDPVFLDERDSLYVEQLCNFILGESERSECASRRMIDPGKLKTKEEIHKFNFFNDMRKALNFDPSGNLPIHDSVIQNDLKLVQKNCVVLKAIKESVNILNQHGFAPLHLAIIHDVDLEIVKALFSHGADISISDPEGNTVLHLAIEHRRLSLLRVLLYNSKPSNIDTLNYEGFTPLILACLAQSYQSAELLLLHGADPNIKDMKSGRTALFHAAECHDVDLVELLIRHRADTKIRNFFGTSPHDAMFEVEEIPMKIKYCILGKDHQRFQGKKKSDGKSELPVKKAKLETTPILRKVTTNDLLGIK